MVLAKNASEKTFAIIRHNLFIIKEIESFEKFIMAINKVI